MRLISETIRNRIFWVELTALLFLCYFRPMISDLEYSYYEEKDISRFVESQEFRWVWGSFFLVFLSIYYWLVLKKLVNKKMHGLVILSIPLFIALNHLYDRYIMDASIVKMDFLSQEIRARSMKMLARDHITILINYKLSFDFLPIVGLAYLVRALEQDRQIRKMKEQQLISELKYLKDRLHPHFFFNTLNNLYSLALQRSAQTAPVVAGLSQLMRYMLYESDKVLVPLKKEIAMLREYVALEKIRYGENFDVRFEVQGVNDKDEIPPLLLLPFIENAFKHGLQDELENGFVHFVICRMETQLILQVKNSVPASKEKAVNAGIGVVTARERLDLIYGKNYTLEITEIPGNYDLLLSIKLSA